MKKKPKMYPGVHYNFKVNWKTFLGLKEKKHSIDQVEFALR